MEASEAEQLAGFLKSAFPSLTEEQVDVYQSSLLYEDAALASKAILHGIREWKYPPRYAEIVELIRMEKRKAGLSIPAQEKVEDALIDAVVPDWVKRFVYARFVIKPPDMRPFRESYPEVVARGDEPVAGWMPGSAYEVEARAITDDMVRAKVAQVSGGHGVNVLEALGPEG